jgi:hypothetical protein
VNPKHGREWELIRYEWDRGIGWFLYENRATGQQLAVTREQR